LTWDALLICSAAICAIAGAGITYLALATVSVDLAGSQAGLAYAFVVTVVTGRARTLAVVLAGPLGILWNALVVFTPRALVAIKPGVTEIVVITLNAIRTSRRCPVGIFRCVRVISPRANSIGIASSKVDTGRHRSLTGVLVVATATSSDADHRGLACTS